MRTKHVYGLFYAASVVVAILSLAAPVAGQGTMGTVPDPISSRELSRYADRLGLSAQQRQAIQVMHDGYREEFRLLREGAIEEFLLSARGLRGGAAALMMDREATEQSLKDLAAIQSKIKSLDNRLFDQVQSVLSDEQVARMPGVRQARERVRYRTGLGRMAGFLNPAIQIDLSDLVEELKLSPEERDATTAVLSSYESALTAAARRLHEHAVRMTLDMIDQLQSSGITPEAMRDPEQRGKMWETFRSVWGELNRQLAEQAAEMSDLNRGTLRTLQSVLPVEKAQRLRDDYYSRAYREVTSGTGSTGRAIGRAHV